MPVSIFRGNFGREGAGFIRRHGCAVVPDASDNRAARQSSKSQAPSSRETSSPKHQVAALFGASVFGISLVLGSWDLELLRRLWRLNVRRSPCSLRSANLPPAPVPSGAPPRTASGLDADTAPVTTASHIFLPPTPPCNRAYGSRTDVPAAARSSQHTRMVSSDPASD